MINRRSNIGKCIHSFSLSFNLWLISSLEFRISRMLQRWISNSERPFRGIVHFRCKHLVMSDLLHVQQIAHTLARRYDTKRDHMRANWIWKHFVMIGWIPVEVPKQVVTWSAIYTHQATRILYLLSFCCFFLRSRLVRNVLIFPYLWLSLSFFPRKRFHFSYQVDSWVDLCGSILPLGSIIAVGPSNPLAYPTREYIRLLRSIRLVGPSDPWVHPTR